MTADFVPIIKSYTLEIQYQDATDFLPPNRDVFQKTAATPTSILGDTYDSSVPFISGHEIIVAYRISVTIEAENLGEVDGGSGSGVEYVTMR